MNDTLNKVSLNKASICCVVTMEVIDFAKKTEADQAEVKKHLNGLIESAVIDIAPDDRLILEKEHGAVIMCNGSLEEALEDALFISLTVRDEILKSNAQSLKPWYVQFGINLGNVKLTTKKGQQALVGEGVDEAERIMSFANPNQILVSRVYYDMASKVTKDISNMFEQYDMHAHEQEIYAVQLKAAQIEPLINEEETLPQAWVSKVNWKYATVGLLVAAVVFGLGKQAFAPSLPQITMEDPVPEPVAEKESIKAEAKPVAEAALTPTTNSAQVMADDPVVTPVAEVVPSQVKSDESPQRPVKVVKKKTKPVVEAQSSTSQVEKPKVDVTENRTVNNAPEKTVETKHTETRHAETRHAETKTVEAKAEKTPTKSASSWENFKNSVKSGTEHPCSQAESAMGQCRN